MPHLVVQRLRERGSRRKRSHHRHSATTRRCANMADLLSLRLLSAVLMVVTADPSPSRVPKVYNALITSNQNLEPSKAYPIYQPVLHDAVFSYQPSILFGEHFPIGNGIIPIPANPANDAPPSQATPTSEGPSSETPLTEQTPASPKSQPETPPSESDVTTTAPLLPPKTESPIPLNEYGLPPQILPLGRFDPAYNGFNQLGPFSYSYPSYSPYPGVRLYDPFDPFNLGPYSFPLYRPLPNFLGASIPLVPSRPAASPAATPTPDNESQTPPPEPNDLNVLNYSSKDPAIPNVPPPPLPQGGLKSEKSE